MLPKQTGGRWAGGNEPPISEPFDWRLFGLEHFHDDRWYVPGGLEVVAAFGWKEALEELTDALEEAVDGRRRLLP